MAMPDDGGDAAALQRQRSIDQAVVEGHDADIPSDISHAIAEQQQRRASLARKRSLSGDVEKDAKDNDAPVADDDDPNIVWWNDNDPANPYNWPTWTKVLNCVLIRGTAKPSSGETFTLTRKLSKLSLKGSYRRLKEVPGKFKRSRVASLFHKPKKRSASENRSMARSVFGAVLPLLGLKMYEALGLGWGNNLLAFIAVAIAPGAFSIIRYGELLRTKYPIKNL
ncbi:hypothetical protein B0T26DRAFT_754040 [Lasiosphaeria miniovina]|uniref:Uncharacterized protein n=1 Tax=Lasiosphaeria miniovina TaxID=1954250 RepID=A0AA40ADR9_9PEZI|nr:uncharacterized protein B0T26DRAFT_754040 [Lasiosphaeria miniovina]KAK0713993.1 hypothetical protein B0T26DRAFT_754040 [Lasiosphaeria miniovina]